MAEESITTIVNIMGVDYPITGKASSEYVTRIASYVDVKMKEISSEIKLKSPEKIAVLAAINIADELFSLQETEQQKVEQVKDRVDHILEKVDRELNREMNINK